MELRTLSSCRFRLWPVAFLSVCTAYDSIEALIHELIEHFGHCPCADAICNRGFVLARVFILPSTSGEQRSIVFSPLQTPILPLVKTTAFLLPLIISKWEEAASSGTYLTPVTAPMSTSNWLAFLALLCYGYLGLQDIHSTVIFGWHGHDPSWSQCQVCTGSHSMLSSASTIYSGLADVRCQRMVLAHTMGRLYLAAIGRPS